MIFFISYFLKALNHYISLQPNPKIKNKEGTIIIKNEHAKEMTKNIQVKNTCIEIPKKLFMEALK